jgi:hypothetical protein
MKGVKRFGVNEKVAPRYIGSFPILEKYGTVAYKHNLSPSLAGVHNIFHVSQLNKCLKSPVDIVLPKVKPLKADLSYPDHPIKVLDQKDHVMRHKKSSSSRYNGATTLKKKQLGKARTFFVLAIQTSCCHSEEMCDYSLFLLESLLFPNLRMRFLLGGTVATVTHYVFQNLNEILASWVCIMNIVRFGFQILVILFKPRLFGTCS